MGAGGIIHQNAAVKTAVNDSSIYGVLPAPCRAEIDAVNLKGLAAWTDMDYAYMVSMLTAARHC